MGGDAEAEQELLSSAQGPTRRVRPKFVNYAKRAKRVNVRKLKENIWRGLDIIVPEEGEELWYVVACCAMIVLEWRMLTVCCTCRRRTTDSDNLRTPLNRACSRTS